MSCPSCGRELSGDFAFCPFCGAALDDAPVRREERKVVTVVFCDLVGFTARAERLDPEDVRALLGPYHARVRSELERFGGSVEKFIGDAVMAIFGAPAAHEDDPERAVRAALAIRDWADDEGIELRVGVNTGEAMVETGAEPLAAGDVVNTAARLQAAAPSGGILVGEATYRATRDAVEYREQDPVAAKGKAAPVAVWEVQQARSRVRVEREARAPLVGRRRELSLLRDTLARAHGERELQLVTLVGVPGIGKSRLVYELYRAIEQGSELVHWRYGRSLPYGEGVTFWALAEIVKAQAGILETDGAEETGAKLHAAVAAVAGEDDARPLERQLRPLVGLEVRAETDQRTEAFAAWRRFLEALAEQRPLVLVFEDLHWADEALLDFVDHLVDWTRGVPVLVLATARPELFDRRPAWGGGKPNAATISLAPLSDDETAALVHALLESSVLPAELQTELLARAGGNPLYAEEFARLVAEGRPPEDLPESVQGLIAARLDALSETEKELLHAAAIVGKVFWLGAVATIAATTRWGAEEQLHWLERKEFVRRERRTSVAGEVEYAFRHLLARDVAYGQIPRTRRAEGHRIAAGWIESLGRSETHAEMLAHHYLSALDLTRAAGGVDEALVERARGAAREAGDRALALSAFSTAGGFYEQALALTRADDPDRPELLLRFGQALLQTADERAEQVLNDASIALRAAGGEERAAEAHVLLSELWWDRGKQDGAFDELERARALLGAEDSESRARTLARLARQQLIAGDPAACMDTGGEALGVAERLGLDEIRSHLLTTLGLARFESGDPRGIDDIERGLELALAQGSHLVAVAYNNLGYMHFLAGDLRRDAKLRRESRRQAERFGDARQLRFLRGGPEIEHAYFEGRWDEVRRAADAFVAECVAGVPHYHEAAARSLRALVELAADREDAALEDVLRAEELARDVKDPQIVLPVVAARLQVEFELGRHEQAAALAAELLGRPSELAWLPPSVVLAWTVERLGLVDEVREWIGGIRIRSLWNDAALAILDGRLGEAADVLERIGSLPDAAFARLRAAQAGESGQLDPALAFYRSVGASRYIRQGEALLARSA